MEHQNAWTIPVEHRTFVEIRDLPYWARMLVGDPTQKPRGISRIGNKVAKSMYGLLYRRMGCRGSGRILLGGGDTQVSINGGNSVYVDFASRSAFGGYEPIETALLDNLLARATVFFDIGANWGYYTLLARTHKRFRGEIFAFDLLASMSEELQHIIDGANFDRVYVKPYGLSDTNGEVFVSDEFHAHLTRVLAGDERGKIRASVKRLDDLDLPRPDLIKIDVEDHELAVFRGGQSIFRTQQPAVLFESRPVEGASRERPLEFLRENRYALFAPQFANRAQTEIRLDKIETAQGVRSFPDSVNILALPEDRVGFWLS